MQEITAVLLDWDLTLAHVIGIQTYSERLKALFNSAGLDFSLAEIEAAMQRYENDAAAHAESAPSDLPQTPQDITDYYREILQRLGYPNDDVIFFDRLYHTFAELPITLYDDTLPTLQRLQAKDLSLGIITNHSSLIRPVIAQFVGRYISSEHVIISQDIQIHKPSPAIFRQAAAQLNVLPEECLFVGDNLNVDAIGAVRYGGYRLGLWIDRGKNSPTGITLPENVHRITSLSQVLDFV